MALPPSLAANASTLASLSLEILYTQATLARLSLQISLKPFQVPGLPTSSPQIRAVLISLPIITRIAACVMAVQQRLLWRIRINRLVRAGRTFNNLNRWVSLRYKNARSYLRVNFFLHFLVDGLPCVWMPCPRYLLAVLLSTSFTAGELAVHPQLDLFCTWQVCFSRYLCYQLRG